MKEKTKRKQQKAVTDSLQKRLANIADVVDLALNPENSRRDIVNHLRDIRWIVTDKEPLLNDDAVPF